MTEKYTYSSYKYSHKKSDKVIKALDTTMRIGQNSQLHSLTASQPHSLTASQPHSRGLTMPK